MPTGHRDGDISSILFKENAKIKIYSDSMLYVRWSWDQGRINEFVPNSHSSSNCFSKKTKYNYFPSSHSHEDPSQ